MNVRMKNVQIKDNKVLVDVLNVLRKNNMIEVIQRLEEIKEANPNLSYREIIKGAMKINDFLWEQEQVIISLLNMKYGIKNQSTN